MTPGIRVKPLSELSALVWKQDGALFFVGVPGVGRTLPGRVRSLERLAPTADVANMARANKSDYGTFRELYWRQLGTRTNVEQLAQLRNRGQRSPGVTLLTSEPRPEWSVATAVAELLDGQNQRPPDWGRYGYVYVVELEPSGKRKKPELYVGDTGNSPEDRFHAQITDRRTRRGGVRTSNACVRLRGRRLAYELFKHINPLARGVDACERAKELRRQLEPEYDICGSPECLELRRKGKASTVGLGSHG